MRASGQCGGGGEGREGRFVGVSVGLFVGRLVVLSVCGCGAVCITHTPRMTGAHFALHCAGNWRQLLSATSSACRLSVPTSATAKQQQRQQQQQHVGTLIKRISLCCVIKKWQKREEEEREQQLQQQIKNSLAFNIHSHLRLHYAFLMQRLK